MKRQRASLGYSSSCLSFYIQRNGDMGWWEAHIQERESLLSYKKLVFGWWDGVRMWERAELGETGEISVQMQDDRRQIAKRTGQKDVKTEEDQSLLPPL